MMFITYGSFYKHMKTFFIKIVLKNCFLKRMKTALKFKKIYLFAVDEKTLCNFVVQ